MASLTRFSFATPTTHPLAFSMINPGFTRLHAARPGLLTAVGRILHRLLSLSSTTSNSPGFNWLSLGNFPRRRLNSHPTPTSPYHLEPTKTFPAAANRSLAIIAIPLLICLFSLLFGAAVANGRRRGPSSSPFTVSHQKKPRTETPSPKSSYSESPTLFHQDDTVLPSHLPRPSSFFACALKFGLRGLAFLFRLICMEKLLDIVEVNSTEGISATSADNPIAKLRVLSKKLEQVTNIAVPMQTIVFSARLPDANQTLVAPLFALHAKSKPRYHNDVDAPLPEHIKAPPPTSIKLDSASTRQSSVSPPVEDVFADPPAVARPGATSVASVEGGEGSLPTSYHRPSSRIRRPTSSPEKRLASFSVEPQGVPDIPTSPVYKSSHMPSKPNRLATGDRPAVSLSVEPSGVPVRHVAALPESSAARPMRPRYSKPSTSALDAVTKPRLASGYATEVERIIRRRFDDLVPNNSKAIALTPSVRLPDPTSETHTGRRASVSIKKEECPTTSPHKDITAMHLTPEISLVQSTGDELTSTDTEPRLLTSACEMEALELTRAILLSDRSSAVAKANRSRFASVEAMRENARNVIQRARETAAAFDLRMHTKYPEQFSTAGTGHRESVDEIRDKTRRVIQRTREAAIALDDRIRTKYPARESQAGERPGCPSMLPPKRRIITDSGPDVSQEVTTTQSPNLSSMDLTSIVQGDSQEDTTSIQSSPSRELPLHPLLSKFRPLTMPASDLVDRLHSLLEIDVPVYDTDRTERQGECASAIERTGWSLRGYVPSPLVEGPLGISTAPENAEIESSWEIEDDIPEARDDETDLDVDNESRDQPPLAPPPQSETNRRSLSHARVQSEGPQKIRDLFYSPPPTPSVHLAPNTSFLKSQNFGSGGPRRGRQIERLDLARDTPRANSNYAHFFAGLSSTSTPRRNVDHRRDTWA